jgi:hypothetical protein
MSRLVWMNGREMSSSTARTARMGVEARGQSRWDQSFYTESIVGGDCLKGPIWPVSAANRTSAWHMTVVAQYNMYTRIQSSASKSGEVR